MKGFRIKLVILVFVTAVVAVASNALSLPTTSNSTTNSTTPPPASTPGTPWTYDQDDDKMSNGVMYAAFVESTNILEFSPPYSGSQRANLGLRTHPRFKSRAVLFIERGQFLCGSYQDCTVLVRFDDQTPQKYKAVGPADNGTTALYILNYSEFLNNMLKAKRVRIAAKVYQEGEPVFEFDVSGFDASRYKPQN